MVSTLTANDNVGKPLGFGNVLFSEREVTSVATFVPVKRAAPQPVAFAA